MQQDIQNKEVHVLLIGESTPHVNVIEERLLDSMGMACHTWRCAGLAQSLETLRKINLEIDIVLVDLDLINTGRPRDVFRGMMGAMIDIPIIIFNSTEEHDLALFLIEEGAADTITRDQFNADPYRLRNIIESSLIRRKNLQRHNDNHEREIMRIRAQADGDNKRLLTMVEQENARRLDEKDQIIAWMSGSYSVNTRAHKTTH
ncbi:MAG: response regulator [Alphaproteobacteria bacterium]|nr:response regulator [Alphaproteobacteria bacterium]MBU0858428.1 response regulator [Alphaproteobacteria bacterium]